MGRSRMLAVLAVGYACNGEGGCNGCNGGNAITDVTCKNGALPGIAEMKWTSKVEGAAHVEYGPSEKALDTSSPEIAAIDGGQTLLGLPTAATSFAQVVVDDGEEVHRSEVVECDMDPPPLGTPAFTVEEWNPELACEDGGYFMLNYLGDHESGVVIIDRDGRYVWANRSDPDVQYTRARLGRDGKSLLWNTNDYDREEDIATVERIAIDGSSSTSTRTLNAHHDFVELPDGTIAFIAYGIEDPGAVTVPGAPASWANWQLAYDQIWEVPEGATGADTPTLVFDHLEDWPAGVYYNDHPACNQFLPDSCELGHANSLGYIAAQDRYRIGFRWLDAFLQVDRTGSIDWAFGGPQNELVGAPEDMHLHAHFSEVRDGGMFVFDNRDSDPPSRIIEYAIDDAALTYEALWIHDKEEGAEKLLGDARRIPVDGCDNVLIAWSEDGALEEITRDHETVWRVYYALGNAIGRVQYLSSMYDFAEQAAYPE